MQNRKVLKTNGSSKIQMSMKFTCIKRGCILLHHCNLNTKQPVKNWKSNIFENIDDSLIMTPVILCCLQPFLFRSLYYCLVLFSWRAESTLSSNGVTVLLSSSCLVCMLLNNECSNCLYFAKNESVCVCRCYSFLLRCV